MKKGKPTMKPSTLRMNALSSAMLAALTSVMVGLPACGSGSDDPNGGQAGTGGPGGSPAGQPSDSAPTTAEQIQKILDQRKTDYGEALRTASLKLRDRLPDMGEIQQIGGAADDASKKVAYEKLVDTMLESPEFSQMMIKFFKDTFRTGQEGNIQNNVDRDAAATFAAELVVEGRAYTELLTATGKTCPTYDGTKNAFNPTDCQLAQNAVQGPTVGVLTDPGLMGQYFANMAFRRVRFFQEVFACSKFPAEFSTTPVAMGGGTFTGLMPFTSITGKQNKPDAKIDFQDTKAVVCANCHVNINHIAPLFMNFDENGALQAKPQVKVPIPGDPTASRIDYLPDAEPLAWRSGKTVTDIASLGQAMAADPAIATCAVNRVWNYAMSRGDIVNDVAAVPATVTQPILDRFNGNGMKLKEAIRDTFKSDDFTKF
jgi:hypothetical protein